MHAAAADRLEQRLLALEARVDSLERENQGLRTEAQMLRRENKGAWTLLQSGLSAKDPKPLSTLSHDVLSYLKLSGGGVPVLSDRGGGVAWHRNADLALAALPDVAVLHIVSFLGAEGDGPCLACTAVAFAWPQPTLPKARSIASYASSCVPRAVLIAGASGQYAPSVNGTYFPTGTAYNGRPLFRKNEDPNLWLRYVSRLWVVSGAPNMEANDDAGLCSCKEAGLVDPVDA